MTPYYDEDGITIYHGDCREVLPSLGRFDLLLTDPPYGVNYESNSGGRRGKEPITNDGARLSLSLYRSLLPVVKANHILWFTRWDAWPDVWGILGHYAPIRGLLVWDKGTPGMGDLGHWGPSYELIASAGWGQCQGSRDQSVLPFRGVAHSSRTHPTEKPVELLTYLVAKLQARSVVDAFCGTGSTLLAAKSVGAVATGIEVDEKYCEIAAKRLAQRALPLEVEA